MKRHIAWGIATVWMLTALAGCGCQHQWEEATCTTPKTCTQCGETEGEALGHTWTDATCTEPSTCTRCGETTGTALGHDVAQWTEETPSTCSEPGTETGFCTRCQQEVTQELPLAEHTLGDWTVKTPATEGSPGTRVQTCTICGATVNTEQFTLSPEEVKQQYMDSCQTYSYEEIARNPDTYFGEHAKFKGEVIQVMPEGDSYTLRVNITQGSYFWSDPILVTYTKQDSSEANILEDDIVMMYGTLAGDYTYETVMGNELTVPFLMAEYIDIQ